MRTIIKWFLTTIGIAILLISFFIGLLLSPAGLHIGLFLAEKFIPGEFKYQQASNTNINSIKIKEISYHSKKYKIDASNFILKWRPLEFFIHKIHIKNIKTTKLSIELNPSHSTQIAKYTKKSKNKIFDGLTITINHANIKKLNFKTNEKSKLISLNNIKLNNFSLNSYFRGDLKAESNLPYLNRFQVILNGIPRNYTIYFQAVSNSNVPWSFIGNGTGSNLKLRSQKTKIFNGEFIANIKLYFKPIIRWDIDLNAKKLDLSSIKSSLPKNLNAIFKSSGTYSHGLPNFTTHIHIDADNNTLDINGNLRKIWNLNWRISVNDLSKLDPIAEGSLTGEGGIIGNNKNPIISGNLSGKDIKWRNFSTRNLNSSWNFSTHHRDKNQIKLFLLDMKYKKVFFSNVFTDINGSFANPNAYITMIYQSGNNITGTKNISINLNTQADLHSITKRITLSQLSIRFHNRYDWKLNHPLTFSITNQAYSINDSCLESRDGKICLSGDFNKRKSWKANITGKKLPLKPLMNFVMGGVALDGYTNLNLELQGKGIKHISGTLNTELHKIIIDFPNAVSDAKTKYIQGTISARLSDSGIISNINLGFIHSKQSLIDTQLTFRKLSLSNLSLNQPVTGYLKIDSNDLRIANPFMPEGIQLTGSLHCDTKIAGSLNYPSLNGKLTIKDASVFVPSINNTFKNLSVDLIGHGHILRYHVTSSEKKQQLNFLATTDLGKLGWPTNGKLIADNYLVLNTPEYQLRTTTTASISLNKYIIHINGNVNIPEATFKPNNFTSVQHLSSDTVFVNTNVTTYTRWGVTILANVTLGKKVIVKAFGATAHLSGQMRVTKKPQREFSGNGRIDIAGNLAFQTQKLHISPNSYVSFTNSALDNPTLSLSITRQVNVNSNTTSASNRITVGLRITGTIQNLNINLFASGGNLSQADILSYLLLGQSSNVNSGADIALLTTAVNSFNIGGSQHGGLINDITSGLGLTEFGVEGNVSADALGVSTPISPFDEGESSFVVGRHITRKIYIRYLYGITTPVDIIQLRYILNRSWYVQTDTSSLGNGIDVLYVIERN